MRSDDWLFIFRSAPSQEGLTADGLDFCLVAASFGLDLKLLFIGDGVLHIMKPNVGESRGLSLPSYTKTFKALDDFDIKQRFVLDQSLNNLHLVESDLTIEAKLVEATGMRSLISSAAQVFSF